MWNWLNCYLSGRHDFGITCASGSIFLRCIHCGKRSNGWAVHNEAAHSEHGALTTVAPAARPQGIPAAARTLAFAPRAAARRSA